MNWSKTAARWASCMLLAGILAMAPGCGGGGSDTPPATPVAPTITTQPTPTRTVTAGTSVSFAVVATGTPAPTYQWKKGGTAVATGGTTATYTLASPEVGDAGTYTVTVTNSAGTVTSDPAVLNVLPRAIAPTIDVQPVATTTVLEGGNATLTVTATSPDDGTLSYQWKRGTTNVGTNSASLSINPVHLTDAGTYTVVVTNTLNGTTAELTSSAAVLNVNALPVTPTISVHPLTQSAVEGNNVTLSVTATASNGTLSYQWKKNAANVGTNSSSLTFTPVAVADAGTYTVVVTNTLNGQTDSATSHPGVLTVLPRATAPTIGVQPAPTTTVLEGGSATLTVTASSPDGGILSYQWKRGTTNVGTNSASLSLNPVALTDAGTYTVVVTNTLNGTSEQTTSDGAVITVTPLPAPVIDVQPQSKTLVAPSGTTFSVTAHGTGTLRYQWKKNGSNVGTDSASYAIEATDLNETTGQYSVVVTDSNNATVTSENATLTVTAPEPTYAGDPVAVPNRPLTVNHSYHLAPAFPNGSFRFGYDETLKNPVWTAYANFRFVTKMTVDTNNRTFLADDRLAMPRVMDNDFNYATTTMTRGHQVPMSNLGTRYGQQAADDTCYMSNIAPQVDTHNNNIWNSFEQLVDGPTTSLAMTFGRTWIYTGPIFSASPTRITGVDSGASIAIPSAFYKIIVRETAPGVPRALAILTPHQPTPATNTLWKYVSSIAQIESLAKLDFFPSLPGTATEIQDFKSTVDVRGWGSPFETTSAPNVHMIEPSWDITVPAGTTVNFLGSASSSTGTVSNPTWTFGTEGTYNGYQTPHTFNTAGPVTVSFAVTDSNAVTNTITRVVTVISGNAPPTIVAIGPQAAVLANPINVPFIVSDDTTAKEALVVTASSSNQAVLQDTKIIVTPADATTGIGSLQLTGTGTVGSATVTVRVTDASSASAATTFTLTVSDGNAAPVITGLSSKATPVDTPLTVDFTVSDTETAAGSLTVTAASSDTTLIPGTLTVTNTNGACSLQLTPGTGLSGSTTITITVTDGGGKIKTGTFSLTVGAASPAVLIISQYYEGTSNNKWIEITNVGGGSYDASVSPVYLGQWNNPRTSTTNIYRVMEVPGTLAPGASKLFRHTQAAAPTNAMTFGDVVVDPTSATATGVVSFNGNDIMYLTPLNDATITGYNARTDVIGDVATWDPATGTQLGKDTAWVRGVTIKTPNAAFTVGEWTQVLYTDVDTATSGTNVLGIHVYNP